MSFFYFVRVGPGGAEAHLDYLAVVGVRTGSLGAAVRAEAVVRAVEAGADIKEALQDKFYGDRMGTVTDPFGHVWHLATHKEDVSIDEMQRRAKAAHGGGG